jgi:DNA helicase-2/ATP-dependent DNA helicase PcrA
LHWLSPRFVQRNTYSASATPSYAAPSAPRPAAAGALWRIGQRVFHQKFGEGVVTDSEGSGNEGRVQINFKRAGSKWLSLEYAKLEAL